MLDTIINAAKGELTQQLGGAAAGQLGNLVKGQGEGLLGKVGKLFGKAQVN